MENRIIDPFCVQDVFVTGLGTIDRIDGAYRYVFVSEQGTDLVVAVRLVMLPKAIMLARKLSAEVLEDSAFAFCIN